MNYSPKNVSSNVFKLMERAFKETFFLMEILANELRIRKLTRGTLQMKIPNHRKGENLMEFLNCPKDL